MDGEVKVKGTKNPLGNRTDSGGGGGDGGKHAGSEGPDIVLCTICLEATTVHSNSPCLTLPCNHRFHTPCMMRWFDFSTQCPSCRFNVREHLEAQQPVPMVVA
jgi:hypothetical protein